MDFSTSNPRRLGGSISVGGVTMSLREVQALLEGLEAERPEMMGHIRALPSDDSMSYQDKVLYIREIIRQDYDSYTSVFLSASSGGEPIDQHLPPLPPLARGETDAATRELIKLLNEEDSRKRRFFFCAVCLNDEAEINGSFTLDCGHRFCSECLERYIGSKIEGNEVSDDKLICPASDCNCPITHTTVRGLTVDVGNRKAFEKFDSFRTDLYIHTAILLGKGMRCPSETCNYAFEWCPDGSSLAFECPQCASSYCLNCAAAKGGIGPGHAPFSCEIQLERMAELAEERRKYDEWVELNGKANELFENMISANNWRRCPCCSAAIERTQGCDHMSCSVCKANFCYICGKHNPTNPTQRGDCGSVCPKRSK